MPRLSPSKNPFIKQLTPLERLRHNRTILQGAKPGASQDCLLLNLPPELRNRIYELVLVDQDLIEIVTDVVARRYADGEESKAVIKEPSLLRTCQTIRNEATQLYYSSNKFVTERIALLVRWLKGLTPEKRAMLKNVRTTCGLMRGFYRTTSMPSLLMEIEWCENSFRGYECMLGPDVLHVYIDTDGQGSAFTKFEIVSLMDAQQWTAYWVHRGQILEALGA